MHRQLLQRWPSCWSAALWDVGCSSAPTTECPQLRGPSGAEDDEVSTYYCSCPRSAPLAACEITCGVQAGVIRVQGPPSDSSTVPCRHVNPCQRVPHDAIFARPLTGILWSCDATRYGKRSFPTSAPLIWNSLYTDDRSRRFYFNDQLQWTFESWTVSQSLRNWLSAYVTVNFRVCANINIFTYLLTYLTLLDNAMPHQPRFMML